MPDNIQGQPNIQEGANVVAGQEGAKKPIEAPEVIGKSVAPQPTPPADNKAAIQNVQNDLQGSQQQQPQPIAAKNQAVNPVQAAKPANSDPYIKAAESIIEKDKNDPYKEEEDHEDVQIKYLHDRFGKDIKKS